jgi:hypothetical protein
MLCISLLALFGVGKTVPPIFNKSEERKKKGDPTIIWESQRGRIIASHLLHSYHSSPSVIAEGEHRSQLDPIAT